MRNLVYIAIVFLLAASAWPQDDSPGKEPDIVRLVADSGIDLNGDGYYEHLAVTIEVDIAAAGTYNLSCRLLEPDGEVLADVPSVNETEKFWRCRSAMRHWGFGLWDRRTCEPGTERWEFRFSGQQIYESGFDQHYVIELDINGPDGFAHLSRIETRGLYDHSEFREISQIVDIEEYPIDVNRDGLYEYLKYKVTIDGGGDTSVPVVAILYSDTVIADDEDCDRLEGIGPEAEEAPSQQPVKPDTGEGPQSIWSFAPWSVRDMYHALDSLIVARHSTVDSVSVGVHTVTGWLSGQGIRSSGIDGPYLLRIMLGDWCTLRDCRKILTSTYSHDDFSSIILKINSIKERAVDSDNNGRRDCLRIELDARGEGGTIFTFYGWLEDSLGRALSFATGKCGSSRWRGSIVNIDFDGDMIARQGIDGPYYLKLFVEGINKEGEKWRGEFSQLTEAYRATEFETPLLELTGFMVNWGEPRDSRFTRLEYTFKFLTSTDGMVTATADLCDSLGNTIEAGARSILSAKAGRENSMEINFTGGFIESSGVDGPYFVKNLRLLHSADSSKPLLAEDAYRTKDFASTDFRCEPWVAIDSLADWGVDPDDNGRFDSLAVELFVTCCRPGGYRFSSQLRTNSLTAIAGHDTCSLEVGQNVCTLMVDGSYLGMSGANGPYRLAILMSTDSWLAQQTSVTTSAYKHTDFEREPLPSNAKRMKVAEPSAAAEARPAFDPEGVTVDVTGEPVVDIDNDGLPDCLMIETKMEIPWGGKYELFGRLVDSSGRLFAVSQDSADFSGSGPTSVAIIFDATDVSEHAVDGPYRVKDIVFAEMGGVRSFVQPMDYEMSDCPASMFRRPLVRVSELRGGSHVWKSATGAFQIWFTVVSDVSGKVRAEADLYDASGEQLAVNVAAEDTVLQNSEKRFSLVFSGDRARKLDLHGPYHVKNLRLAHSADTMRQVVIEEAYTIAADPVHPMRTELPPEPERSVGWTGHPAIALADVNDRGIDFNGDGLFDSLAVAVTVMVANSTEYRIHAVLVLDSGGIYPMADTLVLKTGEHTCDLVFDGSLLGRSGRDGPYRVNVVVFAGEYPADNTHYWTTAYKSTEFRKR